jgi:hypothetical protein
MQPHLFLERKIEEFTRDDVHLFDQFGIDAVTDDDVESNLAACATDLLRRAMLAFRGTEK